MDSTKKVTTHKKSEKIEQWKCTVDGVNWVVSDKKKCRYCVPITKLGLVT